MDQYSQHSFNNYLKVPLKLNGENSCLPFVSFLHSKQIESFSNNSHNWPTKRRLLPSKVKQSPNQSFSKQRPVEQEGDCLLKIVNTKNRPLLSRSSKKREKQHTTIVRNSSKPTKSSQSFKQNEGGGDGPTGSIKKLGRLLKSCIYMNYDIINSSRLYNQQRHNIFTKYNCNNTKQEPHPNSLAQSSSNYSKVLVNSKDSPCIRKKPKFQHIQTDHIQQMQVQVGFHD